MKKIICFIIAISCLLFSVTAQEALKSIEEEYYDFLSLQGLADRPSLGYRTLSDSVWIIDDDADHVWKDNSLDATMLLFAVENPASNLFMDGIEQSLSIRLYGPRLYTSYNNDFPFGQNDGALWQGAGFNSSLSAGVRLEGFGFEATFKPQITYSQNKDWDYLTGYNNAYGYFSPADIDIIQKYGNASLYTYNWGDSEIRWTWNTFTAGFGTQSPWLGPAWLNPMLGSNNADPYPKIDMGIRKTPLLIPGLNWNLGDIEARIWLGKLIQSEYFTSTRESSDRMISMGSFSYSPSFINGLTVGLNRLFLTYWQKDNLSYLFRLFDFRHENATGSGNDEDQKVALFADWMFPESSFEIYGELGIDDFSCFEFANPFHTAIYTIGVKQVIPVTEKVHGLLNLEWSNFETSQDYSQGGYYGYYYHGFISPGFTNNGQIIGAGSGDFGNNQILKFTLFYPKGSTALTLQRNTPDSSYLINITKYGGIDFSQDRFGHIKYETYLSGGLDTLFFITPKVSVSAVLNGIIRLFPKFSGPEGDWITSYNCSLGISYSL